MIDKDELLSRFMGLLDDDDPGFDENEYSFVVDSCTDLVIKFQETTVYIFIHVWWPPKNKKIDERTFDLASSTSREIIEYAISVLGERSFTTAELSNGRRD